MTSEFGDEVRRRVEAARTSHVQQQERTGWLIGYIRQRFAEAQDQSGSGLALEFLELPGDRPNALNFVLNWLYPPPTRTLRIEVDAWAGQVLAVLADVRHRRHSAKHSILEFESTELDRLILTLMDHDYWTRPES